MNKIINKPKQMKAIGINILKTSQDNSKSKSIRIKEKEIIARKNVIIPIGNTILNPILSILSILSFTPLI